MLDAGPCSQKGGAAGDDCVYDVSHGFALYMCIVLDSQLGNLLNGLPCGYMIFIWNRLIYCIFISDDYFMLMTTLSNNKFW